jgi:uncharacterized protein with PIN domain
MAEARFRFYAELNDFLPPENCMKQLIRYFDVNGSVKDFIESFGVPHSEVDMVLINGESAGFSQLIRDGDFVSVYPVFETLDISAISRVRAEPLRNLRFVLDVHLGRLAAYIRMAGFDALYNNRFSDPELARIVAEDRRVLLTRDRYLLMRTEVDRGYWVRSNKPKQQLVEVIRRFDLTGSMRPFTRCMECNALLVDVDRDSARPHVPAGVNQKEQFRQCLNCNRIYWQGSHTARMQELLEWVGSRCSGPDASA